MVHNGLYTGTRNYFGPTVLQDWGSVRPLPLCVLLWAACDHPYGAASTEALAPCAAQAAQARHFDAAHDELLSEASAAASGRAACRVAAEEAGPPSRSQQQQRCGSFGDIAKACAHCG